LLILQALLLTVKIEDSGCLVGRQERRLEISRAGLPIRNVKYGEKGVLGALFSLNGHFNGRKRGFACISLVNIALFWISKSN
jgi:hypothetical protein